MINQVHQNSREDDKETYKPNRAGHAQQVCGRKEVYCSNRQLKSFSYSYYHKLYIAEILFISRNKKRATDIFSCRQCEQTVVKARTICYHENEIAGMRSALSAFTVFKGYFKGVENLEKIFKLKANGTDTKTEIMAGITTFLAMAYILAVNPSMLGDAGMNPQGVFMATALSAAIATLMMAFLANYPIALASGMGLNAYFAYTICLGEMKDIENAWQIALTAILVEGVIFILLSIFKFRETLVNQIPANLKYGITTGIGLFITFIGLQNAHIAKADSSTLVALGDLATPQVALALIGVVLIGVMLYYNVKGAILWGILATWVLGIIAELCGWYVPNPDVGVYSLIPSISGIGDFIPNFGALGDTAFKFDFGYMVNNVLQFAVIVFAFLFVDLFDTVGTLIGVASKGNLLDKDGKLPRVGRALMSDAVGTVVGACLGTSTVTSYVESSAGVAEGGRTGLTSATTAVMFILAIFLWPIFSVIPSFATAPALIVVGLFMMSNVLKMKFEGDMADVLGGFVAIIMMPFTYSIANGIMFGMLTWVILKVCKGKIKEIHPVMWVVFALFVLRIISIVVPALH